MILHGTKMQTGFRAILSRNFPEKGTSLHRMLIAVEFDGLETWPGRMDYDLFSFFLGYGIPQASLVATGNPL
jgi:hypothetical protein